MEATFRIVAFFGGRERVMLKGLTEEQAKEKLALFQAKPFGMTYCIESEAAAQAWAGTMAKMTVPALPAR